MGKVKEEQQKVFDDCYAIYEKNGGYTKVFDHVNEQKAKNNPAYVDVKEERCNGCENDMPSLNHTCLICGQETTAPKYKIWIEIERIDNFGTDDEEYTDVEFPEAVAYRDNFEDATELQQKIVDTFGEI
jgi:hypothetical protein